VRSNLPDQTTGAYWIDLAAMLFTSGAPFVTQIGAFFQPLTSLINEFPVVGVGRVIKGWDEGIIQLNKGAKAKLTCTHVLTLTVSIPSLLTSFQGGLRLRRKGIPASNPSQLHPHL